MLMCVLHTGGWEMVPDWFCHQCWVVCRPQGEHEDGHRHADADWWRRSGDGIFQSQVRQTVNKLFLCHMISTLNPSCFSSPDGTCWRMNHLAQKTDIPGKFSFRSKRKEDSVHLDMKHSSDLFMIQTGNDVFPQAGRLTMTCVLLMWSMMNMLWSTPSRPKPTPPRFSTNSMVNKI